MSRNNVWSNGPGTASSISAAAYPLLAPDGSAAAPSYSFSGDTGSDTGFYRISENVTGYSSGGTANIYMTNGATYFLTQIGLGSSPLSPDVYLKRYAAKQLSITGDGTGATTNAGLILGYEGTNSKYSAIWSSAGAAPSTSNYAIRLYGDSTAPNDHSIQLNAGSTGLVTIANGNTTKLTVGASVITPAVPVVAAAPVTETTATHTVAANTTYLICNRAGTITVTLPTASSFTGRQLTITTYTANTVVSNASNVVPQTGGAAGTAILAATAGKWATLVSDGTNWITMASN